MSGGMADLPQFRMPQQHGKPSCVAKSKFACPWKAQDQRSVSLDVTTGVAYLSVGDMPLSDPDPHGPRPPLTAVAILRALLLEVRTSAKVEIGPTNRCLTFTDADITSGRTRTVSWDRLTPSLSPIPGTHPLSRSNPTHNSQRRPIDRLSVSRILK